MSSFMFRKHRRIPRTRSNQKKRIDGACPHGKKRESMQDFGGAWKMRITLKL